MIRSKLLASITLLGACGHALWAADLQPVAVGEPAVANFISGRPNRALASDGATASANSAIPEYFAEYVNDGIIDETVFPWIPEDGNPEANWVQIELPEPITLAGIVIQGRFGNRSQGTYTVQATTDAPPLGDSSNWQDLGTYTFSGGEVPMPRTAFSLPETAGVRGVRLVTDLNTDLGASIQEIELYGPFDTAPTIVTQPTGGTFAEGGRAVLQVEANAGQSFQWKKDGTDIPGATGSQLVFDDLKVSDAGSYTVTVSNPNGSVTSEPAVLTVTAAPTFNTYREAVLSDQPLHYYPMDETDGTTVQDLGSSPSPGTYEGGFILGQPSVTSKLGTAVRFDGNPGTLVDLGLFHPGDSITVEAWVQLDTDARTASYHAIVARWDGSYELDFATADAANLVIRNDANTFGLVAGASPSERGQWHHLVGIFDEGVMTIYVDGVRGGEVNLGGVLQDLGPEPDRVLIGATRSGTESSFNFKGLIDEVAIYDRALPVEKIRAHYRSALPSEGPELNMVLKAEISWPSFPAGYVLQVADSLEEPVQWREPQLEDPPVVRNGVFKAYVPVEEARKFYRLAAP